MSFYKFRLCILLRIACLVSTLALAHFAICGTALYATLIVLIIAAVMQTYFLIRYIETVYRELQYLMRGIKHADFSQSFLSSEKSVPNNELVSLFNDVRSRFFLVQQEKEQYANYLQALIDHMPIALMTIKEDGNVGLMNDAAKQLLGVYALRNIADLKVAEQNLYTIISTMSVGDKRLIKLENGSHNQQLSLTLSEFIVEKRRERLISLYNIKGELDAKEVESWQNLIRILTHEIMNSITPISSLAYTAVERIARLTDHNLDAKEKALVVTKVASAVDTVAKRSDGLLTFVKKYRQLSEELKPNIKSVPLYDLLNRIKILLQCESDVNSTELTISVSPPHLNANADGELLEQVIINIVRNAMEALQGADDGTIRVSAELGDENIVQLKIQDNGPGLSEVVKEKIFLPFFTTKRNGSGIGLTLSRQIILAHHGSIYVDSNKGKGCTFLIKLQSDWR